MLRGLAKVRGEWNLVCAAFNLRRPRAFAIACGWRTQAKPRRRRAGRNSAAGRRGRRRSAYEAPRAAADRGTTLGGAESKRRRRPRLPAPPSRVTLLGAVRLERLTLRVLLAQDLEELGRPPAAHDLLELGAEVRDQAHALDDDVDDAPGVVLLAQPVIDQHVAAAPAAQDPGLHAPIAAPLVALAHHLDLLVVVALDVAPVGERQVLPEELHELRLLGGGEPAPVPRQHEARHGVEVDVGVGEVLDAMALLLAREALVAEDVDRLPAHLLDQGARALARVRHAREARDQSDGGEGTAGQAHGFSSRSNSG